MKTKLLLLVLSMFLTLNVFAQKKVYWVTNTGAANQYDADWITMFINQGFDASQFSQDDFDQAKMDFINSAAGPDIVIISRPTDSGKFATSTQAFWNGITKPLILLNPYAVRANRLNWLPTDDANTDIVQGGVFNSTGGPLIDEVFFPNDYLFNNIDLNVVSLEKNPAATETFYAGASSYTGLNVGEIQDFTNGEVIFTNSNGGAALIRYKKNVIAFSAQLGFPDGAAPTADRTYFPLGSGSGGSNYGPPTPLGIKLLVNEMNLMMDPSLSVSDVSKQENAIDVWTDVERSTVNVSIKNNALNTVEIYNLAGQSVKRVKNISASKTSIDVANLASGIYIIQIDKTYNKKFIVK